MPDPSVNVGTKLRTQHRTRHLPVLDQDHLVGLTHRQGDIAAGFRNGQLDFRRLRDYNGRVLFRIRRCANPADSGEAAIRSRVRDAVEASLDGFPWHVRVHDWAGHVFSSAATQTHWSDQPLDITLKCSEAGSALLARDGLMLARLFLRGQIDLEGNLYVVSDLLKHARLGLRLRYVLRHAAALFASQGRSRARSSVRSHYDVPQAALDCYLDRIYRAYSCAMFENPMLVDVASLTRAGAGQSDRFDSLERAQWCKFQDAIDFIAPAEGDTLLDIGCGYAGQLQVALESHAFRKYVGWTHSRNQVREGTRQLARFDSRRWELRDGDYRQEDRRFDHVTSTGMVSHVGQRGLAAYTRRVRGLMKTGGRYLHHALMTPHTRRPLDLHVGTVFHKLYVWPGYHWFTLGRHVRELERAGFEVERAVNLSQHYAKTTAAWYERMMAERERVSALLGAETFRAWRLYLAGSSGNFLNHGIHVYRLYCRAV